MRRGDQLRETHGSWVLLRGDRALKVKKPVRFSFLDQSTPELRRAACEEEVRVNRELAPGIYLGVRDIGFGEHAVEMRRFDEDATLAARVRAGTLRAEDLEPVARRIAAFHAAAAPAPDAAPQPGRWRDRVAAELADLAALGADVTAAQRFGAGAVTRHGDGLRDRAERGLVRDGHGDLRAEHVLLTEPPAIVDRIEFDRALRVADVADDLAFLAMDLEFLGARWAAGALRDEYARAGGDPGSPAVGALFAWCRALVRAKVALIAGRGAEADALLALAGRLAWRARAPARIAVIGPPASGKSTLAARLGALLELPVVSSDAVRRRLEPEPSYSPAQRAAVYRSLAADAAGAAQAAGGVVVDATFAEPERRAELEAALGPVRWVACLAPPEVLARRAAARLADPARLSDAGPEVALAVAGRFDPGAALRLDATAPADRLVEAVATALDDV